ncbi:hypothetical protein HK107_09890 [Parvularcula sp. ZS-1/3]|uniref:RNA-binding protein AU-1/Ribonuclease E/G domain-containing protein n=1 Tax=Parvularcula mediterranea TaxID=2732508 RepID=A0A7Y3RN37_9PROT|nr:ribonuclease E/G [Parvularcula mediterranea]NNU16631.1 hypothetical protein [Parvularcula mediterranea]
MSETLLLEETPFGVRAVVLDEDQRPLRLAHRFAHRGDVHAGDLYWARAGRRDKRLGLQSFDLGEAGQGMLPVKDRQYPDGQMLLTSVRREAIGDKRPVLSDRPALTLPGAVLRPGSDAEAKPGTLGTSEPPAGLLDPLGDKPSKPGPALDIEPAVLLIASLANRNVERVVTNTGDLGARVAPFLPERVLLQSDDRVSAFLVDAIEEALERTVALEGGGSLVFDETEALTTVDVDLGQGGGQSQKGAGESLRRRALDALGRAISLRAIGGQVVLDLPRSAVKAPKPLRDQINAACKPAGLMSIPAVTKEGLAVLVFGQNRRTLLEDLTEPAGGTVREGRAMSPELLAWNGYSAAWDALTSDPQEKLALGLPGEALKLFEKAGALKDLNTKLGGRLALSTDDTEDLTIERTS